MAKQTRPTLGFRQAPATRAYLEALAKREGRTLSRAADELLEKAVQERIAALASADGGARLAAPTAAVVIAWVHNVLQYTERLASQPGALNAADRGLLVELQAAIAGLLDRYVIKQLAAPIHPSAGSE